MTARDPNRALLIKAAERLAPLLHRMVFVGGCATGLLVTEEGAAGVRATRDVDVIVDVQNYGAYIELESELQRLGWRPDFTPNAPRCRWVFEEMILDVMPIDPKLLGFPMNGIGRRWEPPLPANFHRNSPFAWPALPTLSPQSGLPSSDAARMTFDTAAIWKTS